MADDGLMQGLDLPRKPGGVAGSIGSVRGLHKRRNSQQFQAIKTTLKLAEEAAGLGDQARAMDLLLLSAKIRDSRVQHVADTDATAQSQHLEDGKIQSGGKVEGPAAGILSQRSVHSMGRSCDEPPPAGQEIADQDGQVVFGLRTLLRLAAEGAVDRAARTFAQHPPLQDVAQQEVLTVGGAHMRRKGRRHQPVMPRSAGDTSVRPQGLEPSSHDRHRHNSYATVNASQSSVSVDHASTRSLHTMAEWNLAASNIGAACQEHSLMQDSCRHAKSSATAGLGNECSADGGACDSGHVGNNSWEASGMSEAVLGTWRSTPKDARSHNLRIRKGRETRGYDAWSASDPDVSWPSTLGLEMRGWGRESRTDMSSDLQRGGANGDGREASGEQSASRLPRPTSPSSPARALSSLLLTPPRLKSSAVHDDDKSGSRGRALRSGRCKGRQARKQKADELIRPEELSTTVSSPHSQHTQRGVGSGLWRKNNCLRGRDEARFSSRSQNSELRGTRLPETPPTRTPLSPSLAQALPIRPLTGDGGHERRNAGQTQAVERPGRLVGKRSAQVARDVGRLTSADRALFCGVPPPSTPPASTAVASPHHLSTLLASTLSLEDAICKTSQDKSVAVTVQPAGLSPSLAHGTFTGPSEAGGRTTQPLASASEGQPAAACTRDDTAPKSQRAGVPLTVVLDILSGTDTPATKSLRMLVAWEQGGASQAAAYLAHDAMRGRAAVKLQCAMRCRRARVDAAVLGFDSSIWNQRVALPRTLKRIFGDLSACLDVQPPAKAELGGVKSQAGDVRVALARAEAQAKALSRHLDPHVASTHAPTLTSAQCRGMSMEPEVMPTVCDMIAPMEEKGHGFLARGIFRAATAVQRVVRGHQARQRVKGYGALVCLQRYIALALVRARRRRFVASALTLERCVRYALAVSTRAVSVVALRHYSYVVYTPVLGGGDGGMPGAAERSVFDALAQVDVEHDLEHLLACHVGPLVQTGMQAQDQHTAMDAHSGTMQLAMLALRQRWQTINLQRKGWPGVVDTLQGRARASQIWHAYPRSRHSASSGFADSKVTVESESMSVREWVLTRLQETRQKVDAARCLARYVRRCSAMQMYVETWMDNNLHNGRSRAGAWMQSSVLAPLDHLNHLLQRRLRACDLCDAQGRDWSTLNTPAPLPARFLQSLNLDPPVFNSGLEHRRYSTRYPGFFSHNGEESYVSPVQASMAADDELLTDHVQSIGRVSQVSASYLSPSLSVLPTSSSLTESARWLRAETETSGIWRQLPLSPSAQKRQEMSEFLRASEGAAVCMQRLVRRQLARQRLIYLLDLMAAVRLQRVVRGHLVRRYLGHTPPSRVVGRQAGSVGSSGPPLQPGYVEQEQGAGLRSSWAHALRSCD